MPGSSKITLLDACSLLNLYASRHIQEILEALPYTFALAERVEKETLYVRRGGSGEDADEREVVDLSPLISANLLRVISLESEAETAAFVGFATQLGDGEAMTCALASLRGYDVVTDDKKALRTLKTHAPHVRCHTTLELIKEWAEMSGITRLALKEILIDVRERANYLPSSRHPLWKWWEGIMKV